MGARLVGLALQPCWGHLPDAARVVLVAMALTARDTPSRGAPADTYWAGHDYLAMTLTGNVPDDHNRPTPADLYKITRAVRALKKAGAILEVEAARGGRQAVYRLTLGEPNQDILPVDSPVHNHHKPVDNFPRPHLQAVHEGGA